METIQQGRMKNITSPAKHHKISRQFRQGGERENIQLKGLVQATINRRSGLIRRQVNAGGRNRLNLPAVTTKRDE